MFARYKMLWIALVLMVILCPLGLVATGTAFGEWGIDQLEEEAGFIPAGLEHYADFWEYSVLPDYGFPDAGEETSTAVAGYVFSAITGIVLVAGIMIIFGKALEE